MEAIEVIKIILDNDIDGEWVNKHLKGFNKDKIIEFSMYVSDVIKGKKDKPPSATHLTSNCINRDLIISQETIRDILFKIGIGGEIADFAAQLADIINKDVPFKDV